MTTFKKDFGTLQGDGSYIIDSKCALLYAGLPTALC